MIKAEPLGLVLNLRTLERSLSKGKRARVAQMLIEGHPESVIAKTVDLSLSMVKKHICFLKNQTGTQTLHGLSVCLSRYWDQMDLGDHLS